MLTLKKVAVTGGLSSGKSTVCHFFRELGAYVVSADEIVHRLLSPNTKTGQDVIHLIGSDIVNNHQIDRSQVAKKVFQQPELLKALEKILHPGVREEMEKSYQQVKEKQLAPLFVAEIPLLYETESDRFFDYTVVVQADEATCQQRFQQATGYDATEFQRRMARQLTPSEKARRAHFILSNNGSIHDLQHAVEALYKQLT